MIDDIIRSRRSVRKFSEKEVTVDDIKQIVELSRFSPSWKNSQTVRYNCIRNKETIKKIAENGMNNFAWNTKTVLNAQALVILTSIPGLSGYNEDGNVETSKGDGWQMYDAGIAASTFCLATHSKGIGSVILGIYDEAYIQQLLETDCAVNGIIVVGYPLYKEDGSIVGTREVSRLSVEEILTMDEE